MDLRHEGDYQDFVNISEEEAKGSLDTAKMINDRIQNILTELIK